MCRGRSTLVFLSVCLLVCLSAVLLKYCGCIMMASIGLGTRNSELDFANGVSNILGCNVT